MVLIKVKEYIYQNDTNKLLYVYTYISINENMKNCKKIIDKFKENRKQEMSEYKIEYEWRKLEEFFMMYHKDNELIPYDIKSKLVMIAKEIINESNNNRASEKQISFNFK